jgi:hypothetical protein
VVEAVEKESDVREGSMRGPALVPALRRTAEPEEVSREEQWELRD